MATKKELEEKVKQLEEYIKALNNPKWQLEAEGDPNCTHETYTYSLESDAGIVFCAYKCNKCGRKISHVVGERLDPKSSGMW